MPPQFVPLRALAEGDALVHLHAAARVEREVAAHQHGLPVFAGAGGEVAARPAPARGVGGVAAELEGGASYAASQASLVDARLEVRAPDGSLAHRVADRPCRRIGAGLQGHAAIACATGRARRRQYEDRPTHADATIRPRIYSSRSATAGSRREARKAG